jgi:hypothetical protein
VIFYARSATDATYAILQIMSTLLGIMGVEGNPINSVIMLLLDWCQVVIVLTLHTKYYNSIMFHTLVFIMVAGEVNMY